jgi:hypothetical protein
VGRHIFSVSAACTYVHGVRMVLRGDGSEREWRADLKVSSVCRKRVLDGFGGRGWGGGVGRQDHSVFNETRVEVARNKKTRAELLHVGIARSSC